jgi:hypothetical protein
MIREISDDRRWWKFEPVPKWKKISMYEGKYGFSLEPECVFTEIKVEVKQIKIPLGKRSLMQMLYGARLCWQVQVWEYAEGYVTKRPTWFITLDPESTREEAEKEAEGVRKMYRNWEDMREIAQYFRPAECRVCLPPKKPVLVMGEEPSAKLREEFRIYEIQKEQRAARYQVLKTVFPKTAQLTEQAELTDDPEAKSRLELESVEAYFAENAPAWPSLVFKAWQRCNQIGLEWMNWLYVWNNNRQKRPRDVNPFDYELAFNWYWKGYFLMTAEELTEVMLKQNLQPISAGTIQQRRVRLGLTTHRPPGPEPRV